MKKYYSFWCISVVMMTVMLSVNLTSCGSDDGGAPAPTLLLSGLDVEFPSDEGSLQTAQELTIKCNTEWVISIDADWLAISNLTGSGDAIVKLYPKSENNSDKVRTAVITVTAGSLQKTKEVTQAAGINGKLYVTPNEVVVLSNGFACDWSYGADVKYYYTKRYLSSDLERKSDKEIIDEMSSDNNNRDTPSDNYVTSWTNQSPLTDYVICTVGYDNNGISGGLMKYPVKTKKGTNQAISSVINVNYDNTYWHWTTSPNGFVTKYYQWFVTSSNLHDASDAAIAWFFKKNMERYPDDFPPIVKEGNWERVRNGETIFDVVTWAVDIDGNFSGMIDRFTGQINTNSKGVTMTSSVIMSDNSKPVKTLIPEK